MVTQKTIHTKISWYLGELALGAILYLATSYIMSDSASDRSWAIFAFIQAFLCLVGLFGTNLVVTGTFLPKKKAPVSFDTGVRTIVIWVAATATQIITNATLSISTTDRAIYYIFAAVGEELFFRLFLIELIRKLTGDTIVGKITAVMVSSVGFAALHVNYYDDISALTSVFLGGIILAIFYLIWQDITANILAHFVINIIAVKSWLVKLAAETTEFSIMYPIIVMLILLFIMAVILYEANKSLQQKVEENKIRNFERIRLLLPGIISSILLIIVISWYGIQNDLFLWGIPEP